MDFNERQKETINSIDGPMMVISCPGSGKTSVIIERTNKIIESGVAANKILVATFSKAAALEMEEKFSKKYYKNNVKFSTIHSACYSILLNAFGFKASSILKEDERMLFLRDTYIELKKKYRYEFEEIYKDIDDYCKDVGLKISGYMSLMYRENRIDIENVIKNKNDRYIPYIYSAYVKFKKKVGKVDFDDMIIESHRCLKNKKEILEYWQSMFDYIMIDEYQDTTELQAEIFFMLAGEKKNICVVGDDDQSIYSFREADTKIFDKFKETYPNAKEIFLEINYRSKPEIIMKASNLIRHNEKRLLKQFKVYREGMAKISVNSVSGEREQTSKIIEIIKEYQKNNIPLNEISVLYRIKRNAALICNRLQSEEIPFYTKELPKDIHSEMVYKDIKAYYRLANDMWGATDLRRIINRPQRYIKSDIITGTCLDKAFILNKCLNGVKEGERKEKIYRIVGKLFDDLSNLKGKKPVDFMSYLSKNIGYREYLVKYAEFLKIEDSYKFISEFDELTDEAKKFESMNDWDIYAEKCREVLVENMEKNKKDGVYLSTFHGSKGLEWDNVIIISANDGVTPLFRKEGNIENPEEERRLFYVASTRAKDELHIISVSNEKDNRKDNNQKGNLPTRYINEMNALPDLYKQNKESYWDYQEEDCCKFTLRDLADYYGYQDDDQDYSYEQFLDDL